MPSTGIANGTLFGVYKDGVLISKGTTHSLSIGNDTFDITSKDSLGWREIAPGLRNWSISGEFKFAEDSSVTFASLFAEILNRASFGIRFQSSVTGDLMYHSPTAYLTSLELGADMEDAMTFSATFEGSGALAEVAAS